MRAILGHGLHLACNDCKPVVYWWLQLDTNSRLADRVDNIRILKDLLERTAAALEVEITNLNETKQNVEYALDQRVGLAVHVNMENLVAREGRRDGDIVEDVVEVELHKVRTLQYEQHLPLTPTVAICVQL